MIFASQGVEGQRARETQRELEVLYICHGGKAVWQCGTLPATSWAKPVHTPPGPGQCHSTYLASLPCAAVDIAIFSGAVDRGPGLGSHAFRGSDENQGTCHGDAKSRGRFGRNPLPPFQIILWPRLAIISTIQSPHSPAMGPSRCSIGTEASKAK